MSDLSTKESSIEHQDLIPHLSELRKRLIYSLLFLVCATGLAFLAAPYIIKLFITLAPSSAQFRQIRVGEFFFVYMKQSLLIAILFSIPFIVFQFKAFIWPGLKHKERYFIALFLILSPCLFLLGGAFAYFSFIQTMLSFLLGFGSDIVPAEITIGSFVGFVNSAICMMGLTFQIPIVLLLASFMKLVSSVMLWDVWRYAVMVSFFLGAIITPTGDPLSMSIVGVVVFSLYSFSIFLIRTFEKMHLFH